MRKGFLVGLALFLIFPVFSQQLPESLAGIWEGKDRFVFFEQFPDDENPELVVLFKEYYGWYIDRVAEPEKYKDAEPRIRNTGTTRDPLHVYMQIQPGKSTNNSWESNIILQYSKSQKNYIPVCQIDGKMYLNYYIRDENNPNFYRGGMVTRGLQAAEQVIPENIACFIIDGNKMYNVRYWKSDMEYSEDNVTFTYKDDKYDIPRHIISGTTMYSCVSGRSKRVRNTQPPVQFNKEDYIWNDDDSILVLDKEPYLYQLVDHRTFEDLMQIVKEGNSRRKPDPPPLFPPDDLNWHWDLIDMLEKDNILIQQVRERQRAFGQRGREKNNMY